MDPLAALLLVAAGLLGGFLAGLVGIGGGIIYGPVLLFFYRGLGLEDPLLTPLVVGTSLLCVAATALSGAAAQLRAGAVAVRAAAVSGVAAALAVAATGALVTTQPWYDQRALQLVLGAVLLYVVARMALGRRAADDGAVRYDASAARDTLPRLVVIGVGAGALVAAAGVGGGVILIPLYVGWLRLPLKVASATSLAAIVITSLMGVVTYAVLGWGTAHPKAPPGTIGYVDVLHGALLVAPALVSARWGVRTAHRAPVRWVRYSFATLAGLVALQLLYDGVVG